MLTMITCGDGDDDDDYVFRCWRWLRVQMVIVIVLVDRRRSHFGGGLLRVTSLGKLGKWDSPHFTFQTTGTCEVYHTTRETKYWDLISFSPPDHPILVGRKRWIIAVTVNKAWYSWRMFWSESFAEKADQWTDRLGALSACESSSCLWTSPS